MQHPATLAARFRAEDALSGGTTPATLAAAARASHEIFDRAMANLAPAIEAEGPLACKQGCNWCCHQHVTVLGAEALAIHEFIRGTPLEERLRKGAPAIVGTEPKARRAARIPCPFVGDAGCDIYAVRPNRCRAVHSRDAEYCHRRYLGVIDEPAPAGKPIPVEPVHTGDAILAGLSQALRGRGVAMDALELIHAVAILVDDPEAAAAYAAGADVFRTAHLAPPLADSPPND
jgi:hypothetical protein